MLTDNDDDADLILGVSLIFSVDSQAMGHSLKKGLWWGVKGLLEDQAGVGVGSGLAASLAAASRSIFDIADSMSSTLA